MKYSTMIRLTLGVSLPALALFLSAGSVLAADATAQPHHNNDNSHACSPDGKHQRYGGKRSEAEMQDFRERMEKFALSETQKQDMAALMGIYMPRLKALQERGQSDRDALFSAAPDAAGYTTLVDKVSGDAANTAGEVVVLLAELQANAYALLTKEQQAEYRALKVKAKDRAEQMRDKAKQRSEQKGSSRKMPTGSAPN